MEQFLNLPIVFNKRLPIWRLFEGYHQIHMNHFINNEPLEPLTRFIITYDPHYSLCEFEPLPFELEYDPITFAFKGHNIGFVFDPAKIRVCLIILPQESYKKTGYPKLSFTPIGGERRPFKSDDGDDDWRKRNLSRKPKPRPVFSDVLNC
jgi:hypothetical protein